MPLVTVVLKLELAVCVTVTSMGQIDPFEIMFKMIVKFIYWPKRLILQSSPPTREECYSKLIFERIKAYLNPEFPI